LLSIAETPAAIDVHFMTRDDVRPTGLGELPVPPFAPALANAIARATGQRLRSLPFRATS
jgi:isoquinoline 1-oxidoreductase beta subunit